MVVVSLLIPILNPFAWSMVFYINFPTLIPFNRMVLLRGSIGRLWKVDYPCFIIPISPLLIGLMPLVPLFTFSIEFLLLFWTLSHLRKSYMVTNHHFMLWEPLVVLVILCWDRMPLISLIPSLSNAYFLVTLLSTKVIFA